MSCQHTPATPVLHCAAHAPQQAVCKAACRAPLSNTNTARSKGASASAGEGAASRRFDSAPSSSLITSVTSDPAPPRATFEASAQITA